MACSSSNRNSASARASSVLPTPVGPLSNAYLINPVLNAERANLRATDEQVAVAKSGLRAATAYVDVVRDQAVDVLTEQLRQTKDRFNIGEVTRTDVAQAEARRSDSITQLYPAQANLKTSRATYEQVIGHPPSRMRSRRTGLRSKACARRRRSASAPRSTCLTQSSNISGCRFSSSPPSATESSPNTPSKDQSGGWTHKVLDYQYLTMTR
jgi:outer membrane protein TolC